MEIRVLPHEFSVCSLYDLSEINTSSDFFFIGKTDEEFSLVCQTEHVPKSVKKREDGWKALGICGILDFSLVGILSDISSHLAAAGIGIFAVSTYNTDYILVKSHDLEKALMVLENAKYDIQK